MKIILWILFFIGIGFGIGFNAGFEYGFPKNIWDKERNGLKDLDDLMRNEKSRRLALLVVTESGKIYSTKSVGQNYIFTVSVEER